MARRARITHGSWMVLETSSLDFLLPCSYFGVFQSPWDVIAMKPAWKVDGKSGRPVAAVPRLPPTPRGVA